MTFLLGGLTWIVNWVGANKRMVAILAAICLIALLAAVFTYSCGRTPKLNQVQIEKAKQAIATEDRKVMVEILAESDAGEAVADGIVNNSKAATVNAKIESKAKWSNANTEDMAAELERRAKQ